MYFTNGFAKATWFDFLFNSKLWVFCRCVMVPICGFVTRKRLSRRFADERRGVTSTAQKSQMAKAEILSRKETGNPEYKTSSVCPKEGNDVNCKLLNESCLQSSLFLFKVIRPPCWCKVVHLVRKRFLQVGFRRSPQLHTEKMRPNPYRAKIYTCKYTVS